MSEIIKIGRKTYLKKIREFILHSNTQVTVIKQGAEKARKLGVLVGDEKVKEIHKGFFNNWGIVEIEFLVPTNKIKEFDKIDW